MNSFRILNYLKLFNKVKLILILILIILNTDFVC